MVHAALFHRMSFSSLEAMDIPSEKRSDSSAAFGSSSQLSSRPRQAMAVEFSRASFTWQAQGGGTSRGLESTPCPGPGSSWRSSLVLRDIDLSISAEGQLTVIYGDVGSGEELQI